MQEQKEKKEEDRNKIRQEMSPKRNIGVGYNVLNF